MQQVSMSEAQSLNGQSRRMSIESLALHLNIPGLLNISLEDALNLDYMRLKDIFGISETDYMRLKSYRNQLLNMTAPEHELGECVES